LNTEIIQLKTDILRVTPKNEPFCTFADLFNDNDVQQYYEALVGTLKSAKKRGVIDYEGAMLLMGVSNQVVIRLK
jgi:hypothetical protein